MKETTKKIKKPKKIRFEKSGYYLIILILFMLLGFWPTYFSKFIDGTANFNTYFHFHAFMATVWIFILIAQPILIRKKKLAIHKLIGKLSHFILPIFFYLSIKNIQYLIQIQNRNPIPHIHHYLILFLIFTIFFKYSVQFITWLLYTLSQDPFHFDADPDPSSQNIKDPAYPNLDPNHCFSLYTA